MLSNLSDLLLSRVSPDPVQPVATSRTSMLGMSPESQAQVAQQQVPVQQQAQYLQAASNGKPGKTPKAVLDWLNSMETEGVYTPPGEIPAHLQSPEKLGQPVKKFNAMTENMSVANPTGDDDNPYKKLLKGTYGTKNVFGAQYETEEDTYRRMLLSHKVTGETLDKKLYERERVMDYRNSLMEKGIPRREIDKKAVQYLNQIQKEGPVAW